jgi:RNA recognition motif-containing protein
MTYGFVRFQNPNDAIVAMSELNGREICGKRIKVGFARPGLDTVNCKLYVKRVPPSYGLDDVHKLFSQFGEILESRLLTDAKGQSRQVAFVQYTNRQDAENAIMNLSGVIPPGGTQSLIVKYATPPKIEPESEAKPSSQSSRPQDGPYVGEIPTQPVPPPLQPQFLFPHPPEMFSTPQYPPLPPLLPSYHAPIDKLVQVTVNGIPSTFDLMTFHFLSNYGRVVEGKVFYQSPTYASHLVPPLSQQPNPLRQGMIQFVVLTEDTQQLANLLTLDGSVVVVSGLPVVVWHTCPSSIDLSLSHSLPSCQLNISL